MGSVARTVWLVVVCGVLTVASAREASGQGESTYEEYDDESPYQGGYREEAYSDSLEDFAVHEDVLDPITDDDISYSGYDYEEALEDDGASSVRSIVAAPVTIALAVPQVSQRIGNDSDSEMDGKLSTLLDDGGSSTALPIERVGTGVLDTTTTTLAPLEERTCRGREKLSTQPTFVSRDLSVIRKCCPKGESLTNEYSHYVSCRPNAPSTRLPPAIVAQFYQDCIEDLEEDIELDVRFGNPCPSEGAMVTFGERTNDTLYIIQNGSLLVIYSINDYDVYDTYCLDYDREDGTLLGYVCPSEVRIMVDLVKGQLFLLTICLIVAIPGLLVTALLYIIIPQLHDLHGRALALNCVNFAIALLLECFFQYRNRGKRMLMDDMVLENYAEYFILATFFWLLVNCANNCFHAWYYVPKGKKFNIREENQRFAVYAVFAQLIPLLIVLGYSTTPSGMPAIKHYLFIPIGVTLGLGFICLLVTLVGLQRLKESYYHCHEVRYRLWVEGRTDEVCKFVPVSGRKVNKVIYMSKYTVPLFFVMGIIWTVMAVTYYSTYELPIFYDILFGFQGILIFIIFVCMPRPWDTIKRWFVSENYCVWMCASDQVDQQTVEQQAPMRRQFVPVQEAIACRGVNGAAYIPAPKQLNRNKNPFTYLQEL
ncbi:probable G-protein coupled receptor Mth-like 14 [Anopheles maculipalpis]|uniref:probable G-protein coupled receptor Mth-like 14 n=1 Tax=Anopheles maculipalpis TaxID=1496333 RepID=UPI002159B465|nr:probable G-protein coupled receptor Mth-like 14 [Anopheles maculipalpis]